MTNFQDQYTDFCRSGLAAAVDIMSATVEGAQRLRSHQLATIEQVLADNAGLAAKIDAAKGLDGVMAVCSTLAETQLRNMTGYWSGIQQVATENQVALQQRGRAQILEMQRQFATWLEAAANGGPEPVVEAVKATVSAISSGLSTLTRAAADATKLAATQGVTANAGIRPAATGAKNRTA